MKTVSALIASIKANLPALRAELKEGDEDFAMLPEGAKHTPAGEREHDRLVCLEEAVGFLEGALEELEGSLEFPYPPELSVYNW